MRFALGLPFAILLLVYQSFALALSQIWANKIRGVLTTLGILIGVAAVSAVIALITGMKDKVLNEFEAFGANKLFISPQWRDSNGKQRSWRKIRFNKGDFDQMLEQCPSVAAFARDADFGEMPISYRGRTQEDRTQFDAIDPAWHEIERRGAVMGRLMAEMDAQAIRRVCLINEKLREQLNLDRDPTGSIIDVYFFGRMVVIGLVEPPPSMMSGNAGTGQILVPFDFASTRFSWPLWYNVTATSKSREVVNDAKAEIEFYLRQKRRIRPDEESTFRIATAQGEIDKINEVAAMVTVIAVGIVAISLLVGGVGIMNIMLVSVSERTREIGLRKSVGAPPTAILLQFLVEAIVLCLLGGALGLVVGHMLTSGVASFLPPDQKFDHVRMPAAAVILAFGFSVTVGLIFGMFPAIKAAALDPIEALRHE